MNRCVSQFSPCFLWAGVAFIFRCYRWNYYHYTDQDILVSGFIVLHYKVVTCRLPDTTCHESFTIINQAIASHMCITECLPCEYIHVLEE